MLTASGTATVLGGVCLQFIIGSMLQWKTVAVISAIIPFLAFNAVFLVPESPYWLYSKNKTEDAHKSLQWLRGVKSFSSVEEEFHGIALAVDQDKVEKIALSNESRGISQKVKPFLKRSFIAPFLVVVFGFISGHFSGMTPL